MDTCRYCLAPMPVGVTHCPRCGKPSHSQANAPINGFNPDLILCPKCGRSVAKDARACPGCGFDVGAKRRGYWWFVVVLLCVGVWFLIQFFDMQTRAIRGQ